MQYRRRPSNKLLNEDLPRLANASLMPLRVLARNKRHHHQIQCNVLCILPVDNRFLHCTETDLLNWCFFPVWVDLNKAITIVTKTLTID